MKCAYLENLSTTVRITDLPPTLGNPSTKSIEMSDHTEVGTGRGNKRPTGCRCWWCTATKAVLKELRKGLNSLITLVAWDIWKHRNACVFEGKKRCVQTVLQTVANECVLFGVWQEPLPFRSCSLANSFLGISLICKQQCGGVCGCWQVRT
ncbi:hypothetical protein U9M48_008677 [Paspalum notatum var. saurae]|uniref:Uncharacterized protein n=1 Tax=Paspalum notatum var. saurae TaxID=547442 RepID=A0AAQ3SQ57_PASNO